MADPVSFKSINIHGVHQKVHRGVWRTNKYGVLSGINEVHVREQQDELNYDLMLLGAAPRERVACVGVDRNYDSSAMMAKYVYTYDGIADGDYTFEKRIFCRCDGTDNEEPIETHPNFLELFKKYKGRKDAKGRFSHFSGPTLSVGVLQEGVELNPLYGVTHFLSFTMVFTRTYVVRAVPQSVWARVDCIDKPLGTGRVPVPALRGKRNWIKLAPLVDERENYATVAERWMASGRNGWNIDVYNEKSALGSA